jgi:MinD-like ATPase involved in chromosome partitioning or flagellar assembly
MGRPEIRGDQADGLRRIFTPMAECVPVMARTGAGARVVANLAAACVHVGREVLVIDATPGEVACALGIGVRRELAHALAGERTIAEVVASPMPGFALLPAARGLARALEAGWSVAELAESAHSRADLVIVHADTDVLDAAGLCNRADVVVPVGPDGDAITRAYADIKRGGAYAARYRILVHGTGTARAALSRFLSLAGTARRYLGAELVFGGYVPPDPAFRTAAAAARSVFDVAPASTGARALEVIACTLGERRSPSVH